MYPLKQSTALDLVFFAHDANGDGVTGKVDGDFTKRISKAGAAFAAMTVTITERENGWYHLQLSTSHTDTLGVLTVSLSATGIKRVNLQWRVHARIEDDLAYPTVSGRSLDVTATGAAGIDWGNVENPTTLLNLSATNIDTDQVVASVAGAVGSVTGNVGGNVTGTVGGFTAGAKAEIQTEAEDALVTHRLDELLNADSDIDGAAPPTVGSVFHELMTKTAGSFTFDQVTDSLEALRDRGDAAWTTAVGFSTHSAADVWAVGTRTLSNGAIVAATFGAGAITATVAPNLDAAISTRATPAQVNAEVLDVLNVDTFAEPGSVPAATATFVQKIGWMCAVSRNKVTQTATQQIVRNDADNAAIGTSTVSDDGTTYVRGEYA